MKQTKNSFILLFVIVHALRISAQGELSLTDCIALADKNPRLLIKEQTLLEQQKINAKFDRYSFLPSLAFNPGYNISFGRKLDPFTNTFGLNTVYSNSYGLISQVTLFQSGRYFKQNKKNKLLGNRLEVDINKRKEQTKVEVLKRCFEIWKTQGKISVQQQQLKNIQLFRERQNELLIEGKIKAIDTLETGINYKTQAITLLNLEKDLKYQTIQLNYLIGISLTAPTQIKAFSPEQTISIQAEEVFDLELIQLDKSLNAVNYAIEKSQFYPSLGLYGNAGTGYSSNNKDYSSSNPTVIPYDSQIANNSYQGVGFSLNIPLYSKGDYFRKQKLNELNNTLQEQLLNQKQLELEKRNLEIAVEIQTIIAAIELQSSITSKKKLLLEANQLLYFEGKIRLSEVEKTAQEYFNQQILLKELELEKARLQCFRFN